MRLKFLNVFIIKKDEPNNYDLGWSASVGRSGMEARYLEVLLAGARLFPSVSSITLASRLEVVQYVKSSFNNYDAVFIYPDTSEFLGAFFTLQKVPPIEYDLSKTSANDLWPLIEPSDVYTKIVTQYMGEMAKPLVSITLREYGYLSDTRNSNMAVWYQFAKSISPLYSVVFVPDSSNFRSGMETLQTEFPIFKLAAFNLGIRASLYRHSFANLGVDGGPMALSILQDQARTLMFANYDHYPTEYRSYIFKQYFNGLDPAMNSIHCILNGAEKKHKFVYKEPTLDVITSEFYGFCT
jgi:hypothetical protein